MRTQIGDSCDGGIQTAPPDGLTGPLAQGLTWLTAHDSLTGLEDRHLFLGHLNRVMARQNTADQRCTIVVVDLDDFSRVNDRYGEVVGDSVLAAVAQTITESVRPTDLAGRLSGDRFAIACIDSGDALDAYQIAERLSRSVTALRIDSEVPLHLTLSAGIALADGSGDGESLLHQGEEAVRQAKRSPPGSICFYDHDASDVAHQTRSRLADLRVALDTGEIRPLYQPIIDLRSGSVSGFEALARWHHPTRGTVSPKDFIPMAERSGEIHRLGRAVLGQACRALQSWVEHGLSPTAITMSVNVAASQLVDPTFPPAVASALADYDFPSSQIVLEITESGVIDDRALDALRALKQVGVQLAIDDFGIGFSSLARLEQLPFDVIKIDKSFVDGVDSPGRCRSVVSSIITLASELGLRTVAEGVETRDQLLYLREAGCAAGQGYLWSRAVHPSVALEQARPAG